MNELFGLIVLLLAAKLGPDVHAATAANAYVTVSCSTYGVEDIVPIGADFHITTRNVSKPSFSPRRRRRCRRTCPRG